MLRDILDVEIPFGVLPASAGELRKLADLDESVWQVASEKTCTLLASLVVREVHRNLRRLPLLIRISTLPAAVSKIPLAELDLQVRTYNALKNRFGDEVSTEIQIRDLLGIGNLGTRSVVDFLVSVEAYSARPQKAQQLDLMVQVEPMATASLEECPSRIDVEISHYPRSGHRIAPKALKMLLSVPSGDRRLGQQLLCNLDESVWDRLSPEICHKLSIAVIKRIKVFRSALRKEAGRIRLPMPQAKGKAIVLQLEQRTFNCLKERGLLDDPKRLAQMTVADLVTMPGFGEKCVVDLLTSLESQVPELYAAAPKVLETAQKLSRMADVRGLRIDDPRFGPALQALRVRGETLQEICETILGSASCPMSPELFECRLEEVFSRIHEARRMTLEGELLDLLRFEPKSRNRDFTVRLLGWDGNGGQTLESIGLEFGVTRERIRQISQHHKDRLQEKPPYLPILDRTIEVIATHAPILETKIAEILIEKRLVKSMFKISGILDAAETAGRECPFIIEFGDGQPYIVPRDMEGVTKHILQVTRKAISHWGVTTIEDVAAQASNVVGKKVFSEFVSTVVSAQVGFSWLDITSGWFWLNSTARNALLTQIEKVLSVCKRIHISELRAGVSRHHRREGFAPPQRVLLALCEKTGGCKIEGSFVVADPPLHYGEILSQTEKIIVEVLKKKGPLMERQKLENLSVAGGIKRDTFYIHLTYSPALARLAPGVYGIRGVDVNPGQAEALVVQRRKTRVLADYGWLQDGRIFLSYKLSEGSIANGIVSVPSKMKQYLQGIYELRAADGQPMGQLSIKESQAWGLGPMFRRRGGDIGDALRMLFDLKTKIVIAELGQASVEEMDEAAEKELL